MEQDNHNPSQLVVPRASNRWKWVVLVLAVGNFWGAWILQGYALGGSILSFGTDWVPYNVEAVYLQLEQSQNRFIGVYLQQCTSMNQIVYHVAGSTGFVTEEYFFNRYGKLIGTFQDSDMHGPGYRGPSISVSECKIIKKTRQN